MLNIAFRNDHLTKEYPEGIFNTRKELQYIKEDNIGLIKVMGRAILPPRLKPEMQGVAKYLLGKNNQIAKYHKL